MTDPLRIPDGFDVEAFTGQYEADITVAQIARNFGMPVSRVNVYRKILGLTVRPPRPVHGKDHTPGQLVADSTIKKLYGGQEYQNVRLKT